MLCIAEGQIAAVLFFRHRQGAIQGAIRRHSYPPVLLCMCGTINSCGSNESISYRKYAFHTIFNSTDRWACLITASQKKEDTSMANPFDQLMNDKVFLDAPNGSRSGPFKTAIGTKNGLSATIFEATLEVEEGWKLVRPLPSGRDESYTILEANYSPGLHAIPPHWVLKLQKDSSLVPRRTVPQNTTINITNSQGIQIGDHNIQHIASSLIGLVEKIETSGCPPQQKVEAKGLLRQLIDNPVVAAVLGGAASGVVTLLG